MIVISSKQERKLRSILENMMNGTTTEYSKEELPKGFLRDIIAIVEYIQQQEKMSNHEMSELLNAIADLDSKVSTIYGQKSKKGDRTPIESTYDTITKVSEALRKYKVMAEDLSQNHQAVMTANKDLSGSIQEEDEAIQGINSSAQTISESIEQIADRTEEIAIACETTGEKITQTGAQIEKSQEMLQNVTQQLNYMEDIIKTLSDIAFEINLLTLNAQIEASRFGEDGKGFCIIADEMRALTERTKNNIASIKEHIDSIVKPILDASKGMEQIANQSSGIVEEADGITKANEELAATVEELKVATEEIGVTIQQLSTTSDNNVKLCKILREKIELQSGIGKN